jgi:hypothetical protein
LKEGVPALTGEGWGEKGGNWERIESTPMILPPASLTAPEATGKELKALHLRRRLMNSRGRSLEEATGKELKVLAALPRQLVVTSLLRQLGKN